MAQSDGRPAPASAVATAATGSPSSARAAPLLALGRTILEAGEVGYEMQ